MTTADAPTVETSGAVRFPVALAAIAAVGLVVRVVFTVTLLRDVPLRADPLTYHYLAANLAHGLGFVRPPQQNPGVGTVPTAEFPPLFPGLLALFTVLGATSVHVQEVLMCGVGTGTVVLVGLTGRRLLTPSVGLVAAFIAAVHPLIFQPDGVLMSESLYMFLVAALLLATLAAIDQPRVWWRWAIVGALVGLAALTRAEGLALVIFLALPVAWRRGGPTRRAKTGAVLAVIAACGVVVGPWMIRNAVSFHQLVPVSNNSGTVALGANCARTYHGRELGSWDYSCIAVFAGTEGAAARIAPHGRNEAQVYGTWRTKGYRYASDHAGQLPAVVGARILRTWSLWNPSTQITFDVTEGRNRTLQTVGYWLGLALLPFAVAGAVASWRRRRPVWVMLAPVVVATLVAIVGFGSTRTRAIAEPGLAVLAAAGLVAVAMWLRSRAGQPSSSAAAVTQPSVVAHDVGSGPRSD